MSTTQYEMLPDSLTLVAEDGEVVTLVELRGQHRGAALYFMRASTCPVCLHHVSKLGDLGLSALGVAPIVVVPGDAADAESVRRRAGSGVTVVSSVDVDAHRAVGLSRTLLLQHSGTLLVDAEGQVRYRHTSVLPTGSLDASALLLAARDL